jgi:hypothetical protein
MKMLGVMKMSEYFTNKIESILINLQRLLYIPLFIFPFPTFIQEWAGDKADALIEKYPQYFVVDDIPVNDVTLGGHSD